MSRPIEAASNVKIIPAMSSEELKQAKYRQTRVAAYCRVSTDHEEQANSYKVQIDYYTNLINSNSEWTMAGIYADEGISGTQTKNRKEFNKMIRKCRQKKIDLVLCKSISRFARNTVDCLEYIRELRLLGIGVIFEKENINTLAMNSEFIISLYGSFAQAESESISKNVSWGIEKSFKEGKVKYVMDKTLGYRMGEDGKPYIVEEEAEIVRRIYRMFLDGLSMQRIADIMQAEGAARRSGCTTWNRSNVNYILKNEKYAGDAILQKSYTIDCITHKRVKNNGEKNKYILHDCHPAIIDRDTYNRTQQELTRRCTIKQRSDKAVTAQGRYASKYALTDIMICGECGTPYRRVVWNSHGKKLPVWRCINRLDHGNRYCKHSPSLNEEHLQQAIIDAINTAYTHNTAFLQSMENNISIVLNDEDKNNTERVRIESRLAEIDKARDDLIHLVTSGSVGEDSLDKEFEALNDEESYLKTQLEAMKSQTEKRDEVRYSIMSAVEGIGEMENTMVDYDEVAVRKMIECIKVLSKTEILIIFKGGYECNAVVEK
ncbi:recombinase family protein [Ruminococcus albus]|uniref:Resolvase domain n=1 Tax=Ruminococcus albus (strain ATCC 27210 / DSM 20455 / JCM 14654 / NCDO 2250 / 7) TaxID=697329 RepID=E6UKQ4_RUMA7|nr:recombinase family protein [Ruminococcus albus]ADU24250.1 Resolvase domain [Ruminococcus albus 7 = DSM 20455]